MSSPDTLLNWVSKNRETLKNVVDLEQIQSKNDPEDEPFRSKYLARNMMLDLISQLKNFQLSESSIHYLAVLSGLEVCVANNFIETEETAQGEEILTAVINQCEAFEGLNSFITLLKALGDASKNGDQKELPEERGQCEYSTPLFWLCGILQNAYNTMGLLWCRRISGQTEDALQGALKWLKRAKYLYREYRRLTQGGNDKEVIDGPECWETLFGVSLHKDSEASPASPSVTRYRTFEENYTTTLFLMAQGYARLPDEAKAKPKSSKYCQRTLQRQLDAMSYDALEWCINAATLSQYYLAEKQLRESRHCLCAAERIFSEAPVSSDQSDPSWERWARIRADVKRCWVKYGLALLETSLEVLGQSEGSVTAANERAHELFNLDIVAAEEAVRCQWCRTFDEARSVFLLVQSSIQSAREFFTLEDRCSDAIELIQDYSNAYKVLANFEVDPGRQCCMHKRRIDMLTDVLKQLNPQFYLRVCRQLMFELAESYGQLLDIKLAIIEEETHSKRVKTEQRQGSHSSQSTEKEEDLRSTVHAAQKVNHLSKEAIAAFQRFLNSFRHGDKPMAETFPADDVRPVLLAHFYIGRLYSKIIEPDVRARVGNMAKSVDHYKYLVNYCERHPEVESKMSQELDVCREMVLLLPAKMIRLSDSTLR